MTISRFFGPAAGGAALLAVLAAGCAKNSTPTPAPPQIARPPTPTTAVPTAAPTAAPTTPSTASDAVSSPTPVPTVAPTLAPKVAVTPTPVPAIAVVPRGEQGALAWAAIRDDTFDQRAAFVAGANQMASILDAQVGELDAKRATFASTVDTKNWDFAMQDLRSSQAYFKSMVTEVAGANSDTWQQEKDKLEAAWTKAETAVDTVRTSVTE